MLTIKLGTTLHTRNPTTNEFDPLLAIIGDKGDKGDKGEAGGPMWVRYSASADGTGFTSTWTEGQTYIGIAVAASAPTDKTKYTWILIPKGETGDTGATGATGEKGDKGDKGDPGDVQAIISNDMIDADDKVPSMMLFKNEIDGIYEDMRILRAIVENFVGT